jgi:hypothetical protein
MVDTVMKEAENMPLPKESDDSFESTSDISNTTVDLDDSHPF